MDGFEWSLSRQATERFVGFRAVEKRKLMEFLDTLVHRVHIEGDVSKFTDEEGLQPAYFSHAKSQGAALGYVE